MESYKMDFKNNKLIKTYIANNSRLFEAFTELFGIYFRLSDVLMCEMQVNGRLNVDPYKIF